MEAVLSAGGEAKVGFSIIQAIIIDVVNDEIVGGVHYLSVHENGSSLCAFSCMSMALCVKGATIFRGEPFVFV